MKREQLTPGLVVFATDGGNSYFSYGSAVVLRVLHNEWNRHAAGESVIDAVPGVSNALVTPGAPADRHRKSDRVLVQRLGTLPKDTDTVTWEVEHPIELVTLGGIIGRWQDDSLEEILEGRQRAAAEKSRCDEDRRLRDEQAQAAGHRAGEYLRTVLPSWVIARHARWSRPAEMVNMANLVSDVLEHRVKGLKASERRWNG